MQADLRRLSLKPLRRRWRRILTGLVVLTIIVLTEGCYYVQAIRGHTDLMHRRRPIPEVIADAESTDELRQRLTLVSEARDFAVSDLLLPDNKSYRSYADLERDFVVWNVIAAPEFSLDPKKWCFPVAGCVAYRGYFREESAQAFADRLAGDGFDIVVGGVAAYSTLGRFSDPVLNTMMRWSDADLVATMFHELAHQRLYVKGDSAFNESFATAVAELGTERWLRAHGQPERMNAVSNLVPLRRSVMQLVGAARAQLTSLYAAEFDVVQKRRQKSDILDKLSRDAGDLIEESGLKVRNWLAPPLNNARLVSLNLYEGRSNAFRSILAECQQQLECFYAQADALADLSREERARALTALVDSTLAD